MPAQVLISISLYLSPIEIIRLERCLKYFKDIITSSNQVIQAHFNNSLPCHLHTNFLGKEYQKDSS